MVTITKTQTKRKTFCDSDLEMFEQLDLTEERIQRGETKFMSFEEFFIKSQKRIKNLSINNIKNV